MATLESFTGTSEASASVDSKDTKPCKNKHKYTKEERKRALKERRQSKQEVKSVGFSIDNLNQTEYYFENGLRKVYPYYYGWNTTAKERWFKRTLLEVYKTEFQRAIINQSIEKLIQTGMIRVNGEIKPLDYVIKNGDKVSHLKHRHEIPVVDDQIKIIHDDENFLVVDKPSSIPIHPCGKYRYNCLNIILIKEYGYSNLRTMYRLDRLTSGLVILGKNFKSALIVDKHIKNRTAVKKYICKVVGEFPEGKITVNKAIDCASPKIGLYWVDDNKGKESITEFERVSFDGTTSIVLCYPKTGRTHQIRIHLQYLGHPIVNDPLYNQPDLWGEKNGKNGKYDYTKEEIEQNFLKVHTYEAWIIKQEQSTGENTNENKIDKNEELSVNEEIQKDEKNGNECLQKRKNEDDSTNDLDLSSKKVKTEDSINAKKEEVEESKQEPINQDEDSKADSKNKRAGFDPKLLKKDDECFECSQVYRDPCRSDLTMYLHALSYKLGDYCWETELPEWAKN